MKIAVYMRVSTDEQRERQSIETQRSEITKFLERSGLNPAECSWHGDDGVSGTVPLADRPEGGLLLQQALSKNINKLIVYRLDRIGRETASALWTLATLRDAGIEVVSVTESVDLTTPAGWLQATILIGFATFERDSIIQRSLAGTERLAKEGVWLGGIVPYGYYVSGRDRAARLVISENSIPCCSLSEAEVIRLIFHLAAEEGRSSVAIADHLNSLGVPPSYTKDGRQLRVSESTDRGKRQSATAGIWRAGGVQRILKNETYAGVHVYGKRSKKTDRELIRREVPAIVSRETWTRAQEVLRRNYRFSRRDAKHEYLLRGLVRCAHCGLTYGGTGDDRSRKIYYRCNGSRANHSVVSGRRTPERCRAASVPGDLEEIVWRDIEGFIRNPGEVVCKLQDQGREAASDSANVHGRLAALTQGDPAEGE